ncbi:MAG: photosynthetic complex assembly protein PuhC [Pseudomonadota bacterium]
MNTRSNAQGDAAIASDALVMRGVAALLVAVVAFTFFHVWSGQPPRYAPERGAVILERIVYIESDLQGAASVSDDSGQTIVAFEAGTANFVNAIQRAIDFQRRKLGEDAGAPLAIRRRESGSYSIYDPITDDEYDLSSYGQYNSGLFQQILKAE